MTDTSKCGTGAGWNLHMRNKTPVCDACRAQNTAYVKAWRRKTGRVTQTLVPVGQGAGSSGIAEFIARQFHSVYEACVPYEGYRTRDASAVPWDDVPEVNRRLMIRTVQTLLDSHIIEQGANR